jgi:drug/metabolite transporter (DMT)-like permease
MNRDLQYKKGYRLGIALTLLGAILFSTKAIFVKLAFRETQVDPVTLLALRMAFAAPFYFIIAYFGKTSTVLRSLTRKQKLFIVLFGLTGYYVSSLCDFIGLQYLTASLERLILFLYPTFTILLGALIFKEKIKRIQILALLLTYTGIALGCITEVHFEGSASTFFTGLFFLVMCAFCFAVYLVGAGKLMPKTGATAFTAIAMLSAATGIFLHYLLRFDFSTHFSGTLLGYGALLGIIATVIPSFMISRGIKSIGASNSAIVASIGPVATIVQAHFFLGEKILPLQVAGTLFVIAGIILISWKPREVDV